MSSLTDLLQAWRAAERRWERQGSQASVHAAALEVVGAWAAYQDAALPANSTEFMLVADDDGVYVGATGGVLEVLGYQAAEVIGKRVQALAAPDLQEATPAHWERFLAAGREDGRFRLQGKDGTPISLRYQARAHHPVPGFHVSRLWLDDEA